MFQKLAVMSFLAGLLFCPMSANALNVWSQGFETDTSGWFDEDNGWTGDLTRVGSGTNGITSSDGSFHAIAEQTDTPGVGLSGPFTRFDGYNSVWPGGWTACIDIFLDTTMATGEGFDYSVASSRSDGTHLRDFIFHVTKDTSTGELLVGGSNNTNFDPREDLDTLNHYSVGSSGWYTFQHVFYNAGGSLAVDLNLLDSAGTVLWTETRNNPADTIAGVVGGNRYGWFTNIDVTGGIAIDNHCRDEVPEPTTIALIGAGAAALARRKKKLV